MLYSPETWYAPSGTSYLSRAARITSRYGIADKAGSLEPGKLADFLIVDPAHFAHVFDPYATLVFVTSQPDLERVYVGGELMVDHGKLLHNDLAHVEHEVDQRVAATAPK
jgi:cytosine/adenosine deaminase-related metal-dependent hydrolase